MFGSDVTWTWMNNEGVHAEELNINAYSQVQKIALIPQTNLLTTCVLFSAASNKTMES